MKSVDIIHLIKVNVSVSYFYSGYLKYVMMLILLNLRTHFNTGLFIVTEYLYTVVLLLVLII